MLWQRKSPAGPREPWFVSLLCCEELPALCPAATCSPARLLPISSLFCAPCCCAQRWVTAQLWHLVVFCPTNFHFCFSLVPAAVERDTVEERTNYLQFSDTSAIHGAPSGLYLKAFCTQCQKHLLPSAVTPHLSPSPALQLCSAHQLPAGTSGLLPTRDVLPVGGELGVDKWWVGAHCWEHYLLQLRGISQQTTSFSKWSKFWPHLGLLWAEESDMAFRLMWASDDGAAAGSGNDLERCWCITERRTP